MCTVPGVTLSWVWTGSSHDTALLEMVEGAVARNLLDYVYALQAVAPDLGSKAIACGGGVAAFTGKDSPLTTVKGVGPNMTDDDLDMTEAWFRGSGAESAVFELAPWLSQETAARLSRRGYTVIGSEDVVVRRPPFEALLPSRAVVAVDSTAWLELMLRVNEGLDSPQWLALVQACAVLPGAMHYGVLESSGASIACAQVLPVCGVGLFANDATLVSARGRGAQTATILERLRAIRTPRFSCLAAEVAPGSISERNYLRCGFHLAYTRTCYARRIV